MQPIGTIPNPVPKPEHARKKSIVPEITVLKQQIEQLTHKLKQLHLKLTSARLLAIPDHVSMRKPVVKGTKKYLARKERNYATGTRELTLKQARLSILMDELLQY